MTQTWFYQQAFNAFRQAFDLCLEEIKAAEETIEGQENCPPVKKAKFNDKVTAAKLSSKNVFQLPKYVSKSAPSVTAYDLRDTLNRFRLVGPLTPTILQQTLQV